MALMLTISLLASMPARAADAGTILSLIERDNTEAARRKCERWSGRAETDPDLREACAQAWFDEVEAKDEIEVWAAFRARWPGTTWAAKARLRESELALSAVGYGGEEKDYLEVAQRYPDTEVADLARERAGTAAVASVNHQESARRVARDYPERRADLARAHLGAFVSATVSHESVSDLALDPLVLPVDSLELEWSVRREDGRIEPWAPLAVARLGRYGLSSAAVAQLLAEGPGPALPLCPDPAAPDQQLGVAIRGGGGLAFLPAPSHPSCGPETPPVLVISRAADMVALSGGPGHLVPVGSVPGSAVALSGAEPGPVQLQAKPPAVTRSLGEARLYSPLDGGLPWLSATPASDALRLPPTAWVAPPAELDIHQDGPGAWKFSPPEEWQLPSGQVMALPPLLTTALGVARAPLPPPVERWPGGSDPASLPVDLEAGPSAELRSTARNLGVPAAALSSLGRVWRRDLDGDRSAELFGRLGSGELLLWSPVGDRLWVAPLSPELEEEARAVELDGRTILYWLGEERAEIVAAAGQGLGLWSIPLGGG